MLIIIHRRIDLINYYKIDIVLDIGAEKSLSKIETIQLEMSLIPLYNNEIIFHDMCKYLYDKGYKMVSLEQGHGDPKSKEHLQIDGIFHKVE